MLVCSSFVCISMSLLFAFFLFFSVCSVAFVALFVYYLKTQKDFLFVFIFFLIIKKTKNILFRFLFGCFLLCFKLLPSKIENNKKISLLAFAFSLSLFEKHKNIFSSSLFCTIVLEFNPCLLICIDDDVKLHGGRKGDGMRRGLARAMPICVSRGDSLPGFIKGAR